MLATSSAASDAKFGQAGRRRFARPVDDHPVGLEQDRERVEPGERPQDRVLLEDVQLVERGEAVQAGRQEPPQAQEVRLDVAEVAEEDVPGSDEVGAGQREHELDGRDHRDQQQVRRDPVRVEEHQQAERDEPEGEADDAGHRRRGRQHDLRELDLLDQLVLADDRRRRVGDRRGEPLPGQDRGEDEERVVGRSAAGR